jgi:MFS family permease
MVRPAELYRFALVVLLLHSVLVQAVTFVMRPASTYRALELGVPAAWLGVLSASFAFAPLVLAVPSGHAIDRLGERRVMLAGSVLICLAAGAFVLFGGGVAGLVAGSALLGVGHLCSVVGQQALVANGTPPTGTTPPSATTPSPRPWGRRSGRASSCSSGARARSRPPAGASPAPWASPASCCS